MILIRHPRPAIAPGICYGRLDLPLGPEARDEIDAALREVPRGAAVWTSPAARCRALADALAGREGRTPVIDHRLAELDFGSWEGRPWDAIDRAESDPWAADPWSVAPPGGETFAALHARIGAILSEVPLNAILVTHAGPIRSARMHLTGDSFDDVFAAPVPYARPFSFLVEGRALNG